MQYRANEISVFEFNLKHGQVSQELTAALDSILKNQIQTK